MLRLLLFIFLITLSQRVDSQTINLNPDRVYLTDGTVLQGKVTHKRNGISLMETLDSIPKTINEQRIEKIVSYRNGRRIEQIKAKSQRGNYYIWVNLVVKGEVSLYTFVQKHPHGGKDYEWYHLLKPGESVLDYLYTSSDFNFTFKRRASKYFEDCPSAVEKIKNKEFTKKDIKELVIYYNQHCALSAK